MAERILSTERQKPRDKTRNGDIRYLKNMSAPIDNLSPAPNGDHLRDEIRNLTRGVFTSKRSRRH